MPKNFPKDSKALTLYSSLPLLESHKTWVEIDLSALAGNFALLRNEIAKTSKGTRIIAVVKADAYGHGADECAKTLAKEGCDFFAVSSIEEAIALRCALADLKPDADILILGMTLASQAGILAKYNIIQALTSYSYALELAKEAKAAGVTVRAHIKIDTGMNRVGLTLREGKGEESENKTLSEVLDLCAKPSLSVEGMFSHFARADEEFFDGDSDATGRQFSLFMRLAGAVKSKISKPLMLHICNSAASLRFPKAHLDGVRLGVVLYGARPSEFVGLDVLEHLRPVMSLNSLISHIHKVEPGEQISYGGIYTAKTEREIATIPIGYADGFIRRYSGAEVTILTRGGVKKCRIVGRICMDQCMIDVSGLDAAVGDRVILFGSDPRELCGLAEMAGTIEYEVLCLISSRVPRIYTSR